MKTLTVTTSKGYLNEEVFNFEVPEFEGSEKQISWAEKIYTDCMTMFANFAHANMPKNNEKAKAQLEEIKRVLASQKSASFWIENRGEVAQDIYKSLR